MLLLMWLGFNLSPYYFPHLFLVLSLFLIWLLLDELSIFYNWPVSLSILSWWWWQLGLWYRLHLPLFSLSGKPGRRGTRPPWHASVPSAQHILLFFALNNSILKSFGKHEESVSAVQPCVSPPAIRRGLMGSRPRAAICLRPQVPFQ